MPEIKTHADSLRLYHTGAATPNAAQTDPDASLGGFVAGTEVESLQAAIASPISYMTLDHIGGYSGTGTGYLTAPATGQLQFKAPGSSTYGTAVDIANGETKLLEDGDDTSKFVRVSRTSASDLTGTATLTLAAVLNNGVGMDNVSSAEATAGDTEYRCLAIMNENTDTVQNISVYIDPLTAAATADVGNLPATGAGSIETSVGSYAAWAESGHAAVFTSSATLREIVYYSSRTDTVLTVPTAGRARLGTSEVVAATTDTVQQVPPIAIGIEDADTIGAVTFDGVGLDDMSNGGTLSVYIPRQYVVEVDSTGNPDTIQWSNDGGSTFAATMVAMTGATQTLENGIEIVFAATTGHTASDAWAFNVSAATVIATESATPGGVSFSTPYTSAGGLTPADLDENEVSYVWIKRDVVAGAVARTNVVNQIARTFEAS